MELGLGGKVAIVTGASRGLGFSCAKHLVSEGAHVVICARNSEPLLAAKRKLSDFGPGRIEVVTADIHVHNERVRLFEIAQSAFGETDILVVNTPGGVTGLKRIEETQIEDWSLAIKSKFMTVLALCQAVLPDMQRKKWGRIVNLSTITALEPPANFSLSNATRLAALGFVRTLAVENAKHNILVNSIEVGHTKSNALDGYMKQLAALHSTTLAEIETAIISETPLGRLLTPDETGALCAFLCSELASGIAGQTLRVDGGFSRTL